MAAIWLGWLGWMDFAKSSSLWELSSVDRDITLGIMPDRGVKGDILLSALLLLKD